MNFKLSSIIFLINKRLLNNHNLKFAGCFLITLFSFTNIFGFEKEYNSKNSDIQTITLQEDKEVILDANWEFYWNQLISPGEFDGKSFFQKVQLGSWTNYKLDSIENLPPLGYATYRLRIKTSDKNLDVSLYIPAIYSASKTWINGKLISEMGKVGKSKQTTLHRRFTQILPLHSKETNFEIVIQVANFYHNKAGIVKPPTISESHKLHAVKHKQIIADMIFIGCLGFVGFFFLLFFLLYWNKDRAILYFAILCICLSYMTLSDRYAPFAEIFPSLSWLILTRIEYISLFLAGTGASFFFATVFLSFVDRKYKKVILFCFCILSLLVVLLPAPHFTKFVIPFLGLMILNLLYVTYIILRAIINKRRESILMFTSMFLGSIIFYIHIFVFLGKSTNAIVYVNFGYVLVFLLLSMLLMTRFSSSFHQLEKAKEFALEQQKEISITSKELSGVNLELKENLKQLRENNKELDSFNHIVSHDLKAPLVAMHTLVSFIEEDLDTVLDENAKYHFQLLKDRVSKMNALINGLLKYSKVTKGKKNKELFSLNDLLKEIIRMLNIKNESIINIPEQDLNIYTNKIELEHVFQNLISNSIKYNDKETTIITISSAKDSEEYIFSVSDNGLGIAPKYHTKIFEIFNQLNTSDEIESTGIGLSIVKKIVTANNGKIIVESEKGIGTTISFSWRV